MSSTAQLVDDGLRVAPPITISAASFLGLSLENWMYIATILYTVLQGAYLIYRWRIACRRHKRRAKVRKRRKNEYKNYRNRAGFSGETGDSVVPEKGRGDPE